LLSLQWRPAPSLRAARLKRGIQLCGKRLASRSTVDRLVPSTFHRIVIHKRPVHYDHGFSCWVYHGKIHYGQLIKETDGLILRN
jgi:hypothetical protein